MPGARKRAASLASRARTILTESFMDHKVVFDTNIYISAFIFGGKPKDCLLLAQQGKIRLYTSQPLLLELSKTLHRKFRWQEYKITETLQGITIFAEIMPVYETINAITADPTDNHVLALARTARATHIISGDKKHLLSLKKFENIPIISAADFLSEFPFLRE